MPEYKWEQIIPAAINQPVNNLKIDMEKLKKQLLEDAHRFYNVGKPKVKAAPPPPVPGGWEPDPPPINILEFNDDGSLENVD